MTTENILYTDGHDVTVTDVTLHVRNSHYNLEGITRHGVSIIKPNRILVWAAISIGALVFAAGISNLIQNNGLIISAFTIQLGLKQLMIIAGIIIFLTGIVLLIVQKEKYGVQIVTAEGEKHVLVSPRKEYVSMVVEALNKAFIGTLKKNGNSEERSSNIKMAVSSR